MRWVRTESSDMDATNWVEIARAAGIEALSNAGQGWCPASDFTAGHHAGQAILLQLIGFKRIEIKVNPALLAKRTRGLRKLPVAPDSFSAVRRSVYSLVRLFAGYYDLCPRDAWGHHKLIEAACLGAYGSPRPHPAGMPVATAVAAFFERSVVSLQLARGDGAKYTGGLAAESALNQHPLNLLSTLFRLSQTTLLPSEWEDADNVWPPPPDPTAEALLAEVLRLLFRVRLRRTGTQLRPHGAVRVPHARAWPERVAQLAELLAPYLAQTDEDPGGTPDPTHPPGRMPGRSPVTPGGSPIVDPSDHANPFRDTVGGDGQGAPTGQTSLAGTGRERGPGSVLDFEELDRYYARQAQSLEVVATDGDTDNEEPALLPVGFLGHEAAGVRDLVSGHIDWFRTRRMPPRPGNPLGLDLYRRTDPLEVPADAPKPGGRGAPNLLLVVDSSGSMVFRPDAVGAARGQYDLVLLACWGLFRYLDEQGVGPAIQVGALNFSRITRSSGWHEGDALEPVKRVLIAYQSGGTVLDPSEVRKAQDAAPGPFLLVAITDGCLGNTPQALHEFRRIGQAGHSLALLHIGAPNAFTEGVRKLGGTVHILQKAADLIGLSLDVARAHYGGGISMQT